MKCVFESHKNVWMCKQEFICKTFIRRCSKKLARLWSHLTKRSRIGLGRFVVHERVKRAWGHREQITCVARVSPEKEEICTLETQYKLKNIHHQTACDNTWPHENNPHSRTHVFKIHDLSKHTTHPTWCTQTLLPCYKFPQYKVCFI